MSVEEVGETAKLVSPVDPEWVDFQRVFGAIKKRLPLIALITFSMSSMFFALSGSQPLHYTSTATILLGGRDQSIVSDQDQVVSDLEIDAPVLESEIARLQSTDLLKNLVKELGEKRLEEHVNLPGEDDVDQPDDKVGLARRRQSAAIGFLKGSLTVDRIGKSFAVQVSSVTTDPVLSRDIVSALTDIYITGQVAERRDTIERGTVWLNDQVSGHRARMNEAEAAIAAFEAAQFDRLQVSQDVLMQRISNLNQSLGEAREERAFLEVRLHSLLEQIEENGAVAVAEFQSDLELQSLRAEWNEFRSSASAAAAKFGPQHPETQVLTLLITEAETALIQQVKRLEQRYRTELLAADRRATSLKDEVLALEEQMSRYVGVSLTLEQLNRDADLAREQYVEAQARLAEAKSQLDIQRSEASLLTEALVPTGPSGPRTKLFAVFGGALGLSVGLASALAAEFLSGRIQTGEDAAQATGLPCVAEIRIPKLKNKLDIVNLTDAHMDNPFGTSLQTLCLQLRQIKTSDRPLFISLSSLAENEGRFELALGLGEVFSNFGQRTVVLSASAGAIFSDGGLRYDLRDVAVGDCALEEALVAVGESSLSILSVPDEVLVAGDLNSFSGERLAEFDVVILESAICEGAGQRLVRGDCDSISFFVVAGNVSSVSEVRRRVRSLSIWGVSLDACIVGKFS